MYFKRILHCNPFNLLAQQVFTNQKRVRVILFLAQQVFFFKKGQFRQLKIETTYLKFFNPYLRQQSSTPILSRSCCECLSAVPSPSSGLILLFCFFIVCSCGLSSMSIGSVLFHSNFVTFCALFVGFSFSQFIGMI